MVCSADFLTYGPRSPTLAFRHHAVTARLAEETAEDRRRKEAEREAHELGQLAAHEKELLEAARRGFCLILDPAGELLGRRPYEVGEWYVAQGKADSTAWGNCFRLHEVPVGGAKGVILEVPPEAAGEPEISEEDWYRNKTGGGRALKWEQTASGKRQAAARKSPPPISEQKKQEIGAAAESASCTEGGAGITTADIFAKVQASGWWASKLKGSPSNFGDNGCNSIRSIQANGVGTMIGGIESPRLAPLRLPLLMQTRASSSPHNGY